MITARERLTGIDALRGFAAVGVMFSHYTGKHVARHVPIDFHMPVFTDYGHFGVQLFFIISGLVIWASLQNKRTMNEFAIARFLRLFPTFWVCMLISSVLIGIAGPQFGDASIARIVSNLTMIPKQFSGIDGYIDGSYWTLEYELYFYVLAGTIFYFFKKSALLPLFIALSIVGIVWGVLVAANALDSLPAVAKGLCFRVSGWLLFEYAHLFLIGMGIANFRSTKSGIAALAVVVGIVSGFATSGIASGLIVLLITALVIFSITAQGSRLLGIRPLVYLGTLSYPLYLLHQKIGYILITHFYRLGLGIPVALIVAVITVLLLASAVTRYFDLPFRTLISRRIREKRSNESMILPV